MRVPRCSYPYCGYPTRNTRRGVRAHVCLWCVPARARVACAGSHCRAQLSGRHVRLALHVPSDSRPAPLSSPGCSRLYHGEPPLPRLSLSHTHTHTHTNTHTHTYVHVHTHTHRSPHWVLQRVQSGYFPLLRAVSRGGTEHRRPMASDRSVGRSRRHPPGQSRRCRCGWSAVRTRMRSRRNCNGPCVLSLAWLTRTCTWSSQATQTTMRPPPAARPLPRLHTRSYHRARHPLRMTRRFQQPT
jgi:hypothetical protein